MRGPLISPWQTLGTPFAVTLIDEFTSPSLIPGDLGRCPLHQSATMSLFLASTVSAMHRNAHLKRLPPLASHLLLLSHCVLTQYEGQKKKVKTTWQTPGVEQTTLGTSEHASVHYDNCEIEPDGSFFRFVKCRLDECTNYNLCWKR